MALMLVLMRVQSVRKRARPSVRRSHRTQAAATTAAACVFFNYKSGGGERKQARGASCCSIKLSTTLMAPLFNLASRVRECARFTRIFFLIHSLQSVSNSLAAV
jgi:hypothetical protein